MSMTLTDLEKMEARYAEEEECIDCGSYFVNRFPAMAKALREAWARCEVLAAIADSRSYESGLYARRMGEAQEARRSARAEITRLKTLIEECQRACMNCVGTYECQTCRWMREGLEKKT